MSDSDFLKVYINFDKFNGDSKKALSNSKENVLLMLFSRGKRNKTTIFN